MQIPKKFSAELFFWLLFVAFSPLGDALGDAFTWDVVLDTDWDNSRNWKHEDNLADGVGGPNGVDDGEIPDDGGDYAFVGAATSDPILDQNRLIGDLDIDVGGKLLTGSGGSNFQLRVAGITNIGDKNKGTLVVRNSPSSADFNTDFLNIFEDGAVELVDGARMTVDLPLDIDEGGTIVGTGIVEMTGIDTFNNEGTIRANDGTLILRRSAGSTSSLDWDGGNTTNVMLHADDLSVLRIEIPLSDAVLNGTIRVDQGALFEVSQNIGLGGGGASAPGVINLNGGAGAAVLGGIHDINVSNQFSVLNVNSGNGIVQADLNVTLGQVNVAGGHTLTLAGDATFSDASRLNLQGPAASRLTVQGTTSISNGQFNWDGAGNAITTIDSGGVLNVDVTSLNTSSSTLFTGTINNSGVLDVSVNVAPDQWTMAGQMNFTGGTLNSADADTLLVTGTLNASSQQNLISTAIDIESGGSLNVTGFGSDLTLSASTRIENGSSVSVSGNSLLVLGGTTTWVSPTSVSGAGTIRQQGTSIVTGTTTINTAVYDWDGTSGAAQTSVGASASLTINAAIEASGAQYDGTLLINSGRVTVNTPTAWTSVGLIAFNALGGGPNVLNGQKLFMQGGSSSLTTSFGTATINADIELASNVDVRVLTGGSGFDFQGVVTLNSTTITEDNPGFSSFVGDVNVSGTTTINTSTTTFASTSNVMLDSGSTLILGGAIDYAGGTVAGDGTLVHNGAATVNTGTDINVETIQVAASGSLTVSDGDVSTANFQKTSSSGFTLDGGRFSVVGGDAVFNASFTYGGSQADDPTFRVLDGADSAVAFSFHAGFAAGEYGTTIVSGMNNAGDRRSTLRGTGGGGGADFYVGNAGHGVATIDKGGLVRLRDDVIVANAADSTGQLTVTGVFEHPNVGPVRSELDVTVGGTGAVIDVGLGGTGNLYVTSGALARTSGDVRVGHLGGANGTVNVGGEQLGFQSELQVADDILVGDAGQGLVNLAAGGKIMADMVDLRGSGAGFNLIGGELIVNTLDLSEPGNVFNMTSGILHAVVVDGDLSPTGGIIAPGNSAGMTTVTENFMPGDGATLQVEIGGTNAGSQFDQLIVDGNAVIDGDLAVSLIGSFTLDANYMFAIVDVAGDLSGEFNGLSHGSYVGQFGGVSLFIDYQGGDGNDIVLFTDSGLPGDYNNDGAVNAADYTVWRNNLGIVTPLPNDDTLGVGQDDYNRWKTHFGEIGGSGSSQATSASTYATIPEPAAWWPSMVALLAPIFVGNRFRTRLPTTALVELDLFVPWVGHAGRCVIAMSSLRSWGQEGRCTMILGRSFATLLFALFSAPAAATLLDWDGDQSFDGSLDGEFGVAKNWNPDQTPAAGHMANFNAPATYTVTFTADGAADELRVVAGDVTLLSDSATIRTFNVTAGNMDGNVSGGALTIGSPTNPVVLNVGDIMNIGSNATGANTVTLSGANSALTAGTATHNVGRNGRTGQLFVTDDATANYGGALRIGVDTGSTGLVRASGGGKLNTGNIEIATVGASGSGTLQVTGSNSLVNQNVADATLTVGGAVGNTGTIDVRSGGMFTTGSGTTTINATGTVNVGLTGDGTFAVAGDLDIVGGQLNVGSDPGDVLSFGSGQTLIASAGAMIDFGGAYPLAADFYISDATFDVNGTLVLVSTGALQINDGEVNANAGLNASEGALVFNDGQLTVTGGAFVPAGAGSLDFIIDSPLLSQIPHLKIGAAGSLVIGHGGGGSNLFVGNDRNGRLTIEDGGTVETRDGIIAASSSSRGIVTVDGPGSTWSTVNDILSVGKGGYGTLNVTGGGVVNSSIGRIGLDAGSIGEAVVDGTDGMGNPSTWNTNSLSVGGLSIGTLSITGGGVVNSSGGSIGGPGILGEVTVEGEGSTWTTTYTSASNPLRVGVSGKGKLNVLAGATVFSENAQIGLNSTSTGSVTISGAASTWMISDDIYVGGSDSAAGGIGRLMILEQGLVGVEGTLTIWNTGSATINGGTLKVDSSAAVGEGMVHFTSGTFHLTDAGGYTVGANSGPIDQALGFEHVSIPNGGGLIVDQALTVPSSTSISVNSGSVGAEEIINNELVIAANSTLSTNSGLTNNADLVLADSTVEGPLYNFGGSTVTIVGTVDFNSLVSGPGNFFGPGTANFNGGMAPGASPAEVSFEGDLSLADTNTLFIEIGGITSGSQYDRLVVNGDALIDGILDVSLIDNFEPTPGQQFTILTASSLVDNGLVLGGSAASSFSLLVDSSSVTLLAVTGLAGDYNQNGAVDAADYTVWRNGLGTTYTQADYEVWKSHFGESAGSGADAASNAAVPEPVTLVLLIVGILMMCPRRRPAGL